MRQLGWLLVGGALACAPRQQASPGDAPLARAGAAGSALMRSSAGEPLGTLQLVAEPDGTLRVAGALRGLPAGAHGIHLHSVGRCEGPGFESAGGHFNPTARSHGLENPNGPHAGDARNIESGADGHTRVDVALAAASLDPRSPAYINDADGVAIVIHASADDQRTDPSGNSGARIACGVVGAR